MIRIDRGAELALQVEDQVEDLRLDGDVERGGRLVGDQHLRIAGERHGDHRALAHAAGELMRIFAWRAAPARECRRAAASRSPCARAARFDMSSCSSSASAICRPIVSTGLSEVIGSWKIIAMSLPRTPRIVGFVELQQIDAVERDRAADDAAGRIGHQPHDRQRGHALAAAGFADDRQRLAAAPARNDTPSTALTTPPRDDEIGAADPSTSSSGLGDMPRCADCRLMLAGGMVMRAGPSVALARIEDVAQRVAEQVGAEHREADGDARERSPARVRCAHIRRRIPTACGPRTDAARARRGRGTTAMLR